MYKRFIFSCLVIFLFAISQFEAFGQTHHLGEEGKIISPIYEAMLANKVYALWWDFFSKKIIEKTDPFYIRSIDSDQSLAASVWAILKEDYPSVNWKTETSEMKTSFGILFIQDDHEYLDLGNEQGYVLVFTNDPIEGTVAKLRKQGFSLRSELSLYELEHVKNEHGRQVFNLDDPRLTQRVFERMVREGMNPVHAHLATEKAVKDFRKLKEPKLLIFDRMSH